MTMAEDIMLTDIPFVEADATVAAAEACMAASGSDALPVLNPDATVFGLITQKNLVEFYRRPLNNPRAFHAWEVCDARPLATSPNTSADDVAERLLDANCSLVLVVDDDRRLRGMITAEGLLGWRQSRNVSQRSSRSP